MGIQDDNDFSPVTSRFEFYSYNPKELDYYLKTAAPIDIIAFYKYTIKKMGEIKDEQPEDLGIMWEVAKKLKESEPVKRYLNGEISDQEIDTYVQHETDVTNQILESLNRRHNKTLAEKATRFFRR